MHVPQTPKANLGLARVDIDVDFMRRDFEVQREGRITTGGQRVPERRPDAMRELTITDEPAVHRQKLQIGLASRERGRTQPAIESQIGRGNLDKTRLTREFGPENRAPSQRIGTFVLRRGRMPLALLVIHGKPNAGHAEGDPTNQLLDGQQLGGRTPQEVSPCGNGGKQIAYRDGGADRATRGTGGGRAARLRVQGPGMGGVGHARGERHLCHGADARQGLAPKTQREDAVQILALGYLARAVSGKRQYQLILRNALTIVFDHDVVNPTTAQVDADRTRASIQAVLEQLFHNRRRTLDHFARRDLVDQLIREGANRSRGRQHAG